MTNPLQRSALAAIAQIASASGDARDEGSDDPLICFSPARSALRALDPSVLLVLGERGAGKTSLFEVLRRGNVPWSALDLALAKERWEALTIGEEDWGRQLEMSAFFQTADPIDASAFWLGLLVRRVVSWGGEDVLPLPVAVAEVRDARTVRGWVGAARKDLGELYGWLDVFEERLGREDRQLVVCYDQLDVMTLRYEELFAPLRALLQFWFEQRRRWRRLRPKIFLRPDLFDADTLAFPDGSKFFRASHRELVWSSADLYRMWVKRLVNGRLADPVRQWISAAAPAVRLVTYGPLGTMPFSSDGAIQPLVHDLVGRYMGGGARKGESYNWVPNHVQDANARMAPRSFLTLWRTAAERALERRSEGGTPMRPEDFSQGLLRASEARIVELAEDDPWMKGLETAFEGVRVPAERAELEERLAAARWPAGERPPPYDPVTQAPLLLDHLVTRGIVAQRTDGRMSVPDLYLFGLKMKRKGGPRRAQ